MCARARVCMCVCVVKGGGGRDDIVGAKTGIQPYSQTPMPPTARHIGGVCCGTTVFDQMGLLRVGKGE